MALRAYIAKHPGRYEATTGADFRGKDDRLLIAAIRVIGSIRAVLSGYDIQPDDLENAIRMLRRTIHGYAMLQAANGFQWSNDPDESATWMIRISDAGLTAVAANTPRLETLKQ